MRPRRDPGIRQEAFILAATELFMKRGFEDVSVKDVLGAVGDRSASPSVFYYYFRSKDDLYRQCVSAVADGYLAAMQESFSSRGKTEEEWMLSLTGCIEKYLKDERNLIMTGASTANRLFVLDMREQVTARIASMWEESLRELFGLGEGRSRQVALFLSGGIGELIFSFMTDPASADAGAEALIESIAELCMSALGLPEEKKTIMLGKLKALHEGA